MDNRTYININTLIEQLQAAQKEGAEDIIVRDDNYNYYGVRVESFAGDAYLVVAPSYEEEGEE